jgi:hypothetical protein
MRGRPGCDRLAVSTYEEAGEEIPNGDPSVTDAERAAAGRETLAERFAALLLGGSAARPVQRASGTTSRRARSSPASGGPPGGGRGG